MTHSPRSPWRPVKVVAGGDEKRYARCFPCERYYRVQLVPRELIHVAEPVQIGDLTIEPGWYCRECLDRAKRSK